MRLTKQDEASITEVPLKKLAQDPVQGLTTTELAAIYPGNVSNAQIIRLLRRFGEASHAHDLPGYMPVIRWRLKVEENG